MGARRKKRETSLKIGVLPELGLQVLYKQVSGGEALPEGFAVRYSVCTFQIYLFRNFKGEGDVEVDDQ